MERTLTLAERSTRRAFRSWAQDVLMSPPVRTQYLVRASLIATLSFPALASAGIISTENAKPGTGDFLPGDDGTAAGAGVCDVYPGQWSVKQGDSIHFKVKAATGYDLRVFRLGWYGGLGAHEQAVVTGKAADPQAYPTADATYGLVEAKWHDSVVVATDATWVPGLYVARVEQTDGKQADTVFVVRDDAMAAKLPVLFVISTNTNEAYNAWPGPSRGGKSLYAFNCSSATVTTDTISPPIQATEVSYDRPFFVGGGTADILRYEYPFIRWLEKQGAWDVAYATDQDLHVNPGLMMGRKAVVFVGHTEYWSRAMFDGAIAARDAGVNMLFATGDSVSWQVRLEAGSAGAYSTMVGYKENAANDPQAGTSSVTKAWKSAPINHPGMLLTGVQSSGQIRDTTGAGKPDYATDSTGATAIGWADFKPSSGAIGGSSTSWLFAGTKSSDGTSPMKSSDRIKNVWGYEVDSTLGGDPSFDAYRPAGQTVLGGIYQVSDGTEKGASGYYKASSGAEVIGLGAIGFSWSLDDYAELTAASPAPPTSVDTNAQQMMINVFTRWVGGTVVPTDAGVVDVGTDTAMADTSVADTAVTDTALPDAMDDAMADTAVADSTLVDSSTDGAMADVSVDDATPDAASDGTLADAPETAVDSSAGDVAVADTSTAEDAAVDSAAPDAGSADTGTDALVAEGDGGCGCAVPGGSERGPAGTLGLLGALGLLAARRRRKRD